MRLSSSSLSSLCLTAGLILLAGCGGITGERKDDLTISPKLATVARDSVTNFTFSYNTSGSGAVLWSTTGGSVSQAGAYRGPKFDGLFEVQVSSVERPSVFAKALVAVGDNNGGQITPATLALGIGEKSSLTSAFIDVTNEDTEWLTTGGTILSTGPTSADFTAPDAAGSVTVIARNKENQVLFGKRVVEVRNIAVSVSPDGLAVGPGSKVFFNATVTGPANTAVTWTANAGTITDAGEWTAPAATGTYRVTATSKANSSFSASSTVIVR